MEEDKENFFEEFKQTILKEIETCGNNSSELLSRSKTSIENTLIRVLEMEKSGKEIPLNCYKMKKLYVLSILTELDEKAYSDFFNVFFKTLSNPGQIFHDYFYSKLKNKIKR